MVAKPAVRTDLRLQGSRGSRRAALLGAASALLGAGTAQAGAAPGALPQDPTVAGGAATFARSGQTLTVDQSTSRAVIDWRSFDIGAGAQATFNQPSASAIAVNRVNAGTDPTHIDGALRANGQVWVLNPNGVMFGKGAVVNVAGIVASTANIDAARFMAGDSRLTFTGADRGLVANEGAITVADNGLAAFVAPSVRNSGAINARVGKVTLAAGSTFTLDLAGDRLIEIGLGAGHAVVDQSGSIVNEGGVVTLSARSAGQVVDSVINMSGVVSTASARQAGGQIVLEGDTASLTGLADASGASGGRITLAANTIRVGPQANLRADSVSGGDGGTITAVAAVRGDYAGAYSARGGPSGGAGGQIETSGKVLHIADGISVDTRAPAGVMGTWTIDPDNLTVVASGAGNIGGGVNSEDATISADTVVQALNTSSVNLQANVSISVDAAIDSSAQGNSNTLTFKDQNADGQLTINLNAPITLGAHQHLAGMANVVNLTDSGLVQNAIDVASTAGATVNVGPGNYEPGATINKSNLALLGTPGLSEIDVNPGSAQVNAITIAGNTSGVRVAGFKIVGEITGSYVDYAFGSGISRGVFAAQGATGFTISNNVIRNVRTGVLVDGRNGVGNAITGNTIDNTKSAISVQYTAGAGIDISGNLQGPFGNEWGENLHLNGTFNGATIVANSTGDAPQGVQTTLLAAKAANGGWSVQDQGYATSNRTEVFVAPNGSAANQGSPRAKLATIQAGIAAVVAGGTVNVADGTYVISSSVPYLGLTKSLNLVGQSQAGTIIDAHGASQYGLRVTADNVSLSNFTLLGASGAGSSYGIKVENNTDPSPDARIYNLSISNVTSHGARKAQLDLNGVVGATIDHFTADGTSNGFGSGSQAGAGIAISDSANVTITNSSTHDNAWGGLALYQTNTARNQQMTGVTVAASNSFAESVPVYAEDTSSSRDFGALNIGGFAYIVRPTSNPADIVTVFQRTQQAAIDYAVSAAPSTAWIQGYGSGITGNNVFTVSQALSLQTAYNAATSGATINVLSGSYAGNFAADTLTNFNFGTVSLAGAFTLNAGAAGSALSGNLSATSIALNGPVILSGAATLNTRAANGSIVTGSIDGGGAGGQALTLDAGGGTISLGSLGSSARLGAIQAVSSTILTGGAYNAASFTFGGDVVLTAAQTTVDTAPAAGNISVAGSLLGSSDGAQSLALAAGSGDISLQNVGAKALRLNNLSVSGDDFGAQTVDLAGDFNAKLTGNQVFSAHTLNAGGQVNSTVGGNASGPINAGQSVSFAVAGDVTGAIAGTDVSLNAGTLTNAAVNASQSAAVVAQAVTGSSVAAAQNVSMTAATMNASSVSASQSASVNAGSMAGSTVAATQNVNVSAGSVTNSTLSSNQTVTLAANQVQGSTFSASQAVNVSAGSVSGSSLTAPQVSANAASFNGTVSASGSASITGGDISGSFSGGSFKIAGTGAVNANVTATSLSVDTPRGTVTGSWQSLDTGSSGRGVSVNNQPVNVQGSGVSANQIVVENFTLPAGSVVTKTGEIVLPQGQMIGLLSPGGASGAPKLIQVQTVQQLGSLLAEGYTAIIIDLSGHDKASTDDQTVKVSQN